MGWALLPLSLSYSAHRPQWLFQARLAVAAQSLGHVRLFVTPRTVAFQAPSSSTVSQSLFKCTSTELVTLSNHLILCGPPLLLPSIFPNIKLFSIESALCTRWPNFWSFSFSISPSSEYPGLISFRMDWFDLLAVQGTLKDLLQHHNLGKASILPCLALFMIQIQVLYMTTGKTSTVRRVTNSLTRLSS